MIHITDNSSGPLHRVPTTAKLLALLILSVLLFAATSALFLLALAGCILAVALICSRAALAQWLMAWTLLFTIAVVVTWTWASSGLEAASVVLLRLSALSLFATIVTATTTIGQFIDTITALARPLERIGLANARDIGLAIGLVVRFIPEVQSRYVAIADAHRARGLKMRIATVVVPVIIGTILSADEIANAIDARSIRAQNAKRD